MTTNNTKIGAEGEKRAENFLRKIGYEIIEKNWRSRFGEIDLIAKEGNALVFIEVKSKANKRFGLSGEMITKGKLQKIIKTAQIYNVENYYDGHWRIDAILLENNKVQLIKNITL